MWVFAVIVSLTIALPYLAISSLVVRGLSKSHQLRSNYLGVGTAMIFFSCGVGHLLHAEHMAFGGQEFRDAADLHVTVWDGSTAVIALWYLSMRARYAQLLQSPAMFEDHSQVAIDAEAHRLADHDHLTGLLNRQALSRIVGAALVDADNMTRGLLFLDLDGFKEINDSFGHSAGDAVLKAAVARFQAALRPGDLLARLGGDEFVVFLEGAATEEGAAVVAKRLSDGLEVPFIVENGLVNMTASIGIALTVPGDLSASNLLHQADLAMYHAKNRGPGRCSFGGARPPAVA